MHRTADNNLLTVLVNEINGLEQIEDHTFLSHFPFYCEELVRALLSQKELPMSFSPVLVLITLQKSVLGRPLNRILQYSMYLEQRK